LNSLYFWADRSVQLHYAIHSPYILATLLLSMVLLPLEHGIDGVVV